MHRRDLLQTGGALGALAFCPSAAQAREGGSPRRVVVIGAGIMGVSIAYHLAKAGTRVVVLERATPGSQATQGAFAMLIATHEGAGKAFNDLYGLAIADWRRLDAELGGAVQVQWGGAATWAAPGAKADALGGITRQLQGWGAPIETLTAERLQQLVPGVVPGPFGAGNFSPRQGTLDPMQALVALVAAAQRQGVEFRFPCAACALTVDGQVVTGVQTSQGPVKADVVVAAAGADTPGLARTVGAKAPINLVSGTLAHSKPFPRVLRRVLNGPLGSLKQDPDGRIVTGADYRPGASGADVSQAYGEQLLATAAQMVPALNGAQLDAMTLGYVPIPVDTHPIVGFCAAPTNLYLALSMSGITMAPLMGRLAAGEILEGVQAALLADYRPARFS